ncbi:MAG: hypothetical protein MUP55_00925 [Candidatus Aenigmarchaeota archaeon]|nr:hypothetical protein [Candidatus Aenigmarchaeota archaeon]
MEGTDSHIYRAFIEKVRAKNLLESIKSGEDGSLPFTRAFEYIRNQDIPEDAKTKGYIGIINSLDEFCNDRENEKMIYPVHRESIKNLISCAKTDVEDGKMGDAESDLYTIEKSYLFTLWKKLSYIKAPDIRKYLLKNMIQADFDIREMGAYIELKE